MNKKTLLLVLFLGVVSMLSGLAIGAVNSVVSPVIEENAIRAQNRNLELIFPGANFVAMEYNDDSNTVLEVYNAEGKGIIVKATGIGFNSSEPIVCLFGFDNSGKCVDVKVLAQQETNGYGTHCFEEENIQSLYVGKSLNQQADLYSGATVTSTAMRKMMDAAQKAFQEVR